MDFRYFENFPKMFRKSGTIFKINFRNQILKVTIQKNETTFSLEGDKEITVYVNGAAILVEPNSLVTV